MIDSLDSSAGETGSPVADLKKSRRPRRAPSLAGSVDRLPPHSIEAEQGVLGCALLSPNDSLGICLEKLKGGSEVFYDLRHQAIFDVLVTMYDQKAPIDLITLQQQLKDRGQLDAVGGVAYLSSLPDAVPSAANLEYYLEIVKEKHVLRRMIQTCTGVVGQVYDYEGAVDKLMDEVERDILRISEERVESTTRTMKDLVHKAINTIEDFHARQGMLTGIPTGFTDLDKMTSGMHPGEMIVIAARPSMGKCLTSDAEILLADGSVATIEELYRRKEANLLTLTDEFRLRLAQPSAYVDDGVKPVYKVTTRLGRTVEATLPHPFLTIEGWKPLGQLKAGVRIAVPRKLEFFGTTKWRECEIKLLAYLLGDGCVSKSSPTFTNGNPQLQGDFAGAAGEFGGITTRAFDSNGSRTTSFQIAGNAAAIRNGRNLFAARLQGRLTSSRTSKRQLALKVGASPASVTQWTKGRCVPDADHWRAVCSALETEAETLAPEGIHAIGKNRLNPLTAWLDTLGIKGARAGDKFIPADVFKLERAQVALFLNRLFATDGWATVLTSGQAQIGYATVSERLARQIQHLLLRFGVIASLRRRQVKYQGTRRTAWQLDVTDQLSLRTFVTEIGIFGKDRAVEKVRCAIARKRYQTNRDLVPVEIWGSIRAAKGSESWASLARRAGSNGSNPHVGKRAFSRSRLAAFAKALANEQLQHIAESDVYWDEIVSVEPAGKKQVYDLTIPGTHNFVANDICVHNTSLAMNIAEHVAVEAKLPVGVFSLEMTSESLVLRMLCSRSRVNLRNIRDGFLAERDFPKLTGAAGKLANSPMFIDDTSGLSILQLRAKARRMWQQHQIKLFVIDYLQLLNSTARRADQNRQQEIADISSGIKSLAKELNVPVIVLAQLNRELEKDRNRKPRLSDLRESGSIEQDADLVGLLYDPNRAEEEDAAVVREEQDAKPVNLLIAKQRNGPTGDVPLLFMKSYTRFESAAKVSADDVPTE
ncbi:MAG: replicative DNA helicase [Verrucomicrobiota bacterium]